MKIDKDVKLEDECKPYRNGTKSLISSMSVGDSIFAASKRKIETLRTAAWVVRKEKGFTFTTRIVEGGWRLWRIS